MSFPPDIIDPREKENYPGLDYDPSRKSNFYVEDFNEATDHIADIENFILAHCLPKRGQLWCDEMTVLVGAAAATAVNASEKYCIYGYQTGYLINASAGWGFICQAGDYIFAIMSLKSSQSGKVNIYIDDVLVAEAIDLYNATTLWSQITTFNVEGLSAGYHRLKYTVPAKNPDSTAYAFFVTKIHFKQATD